MKLELLHGIFIILKGNLGKMLFSVLLHGIFIILKGNLGKMLFSVARCVEL